MLPYIVRYVKHMSIQHRKQAICLYDNDNELIRHMSSLYFQ
jgi:hypothetical protein